MKRLRLHYTKPRLKRNKTNNTQDLETQLAATQSENWLPRDQFGSAKSTIEILRNELKVKNSQIDKPQDLTNQAQQLDLAAYTRHQKLLEQKSQPTDEPAKRKHEVFNWF